MRLISPTVEDAPEAIESAEPIEIPQATEGLSLYERLRDVAIAAVPTFGRLDNGRSGKILPQHIPIFLMKVQGYSQFEIATTLGIGTGMVYRALAMPTGQELLAKLYAEAGIATGDVSQTFRDASPMAADVLLDIAQSGVKEETRLKAAFSILDRAGYAPVKRSEQKHTVEAVHTIRNAELDELREALREAMEIEAEFEVVESEVQPAEPE